MINFYDRFLYFLSGACLVISSILVLILSIMVLINMLWIV